jgi:hypothetical protein
MCRESRFNPFANFSNKEENEKLNGHQRQELEMIRYETSVLFNSIDDLGRTYDSDEALDYFKRAKDALEIVVMLAEKGITA